VGSHKLGRSRRVTRFFGASTGTGTKGAILKKRKIDMRQRTPGPLGWVLKSGSRRLVGRALVIWAVRREGAMAGKRTEPLRRGEERSILASISAGRS